MALGIITLVDFLTSKIEGIMENPGKAGITVASNKWSQQEISSIKGAFTFTLLALQERLSHLPNAEQKYVLPIVAKLNWDVGSAFWRGTIIDNDGHKPLYTASAPHKALIRILLFITVHWPKLNKSSSKIFELDFSEILQLAAIVSNSTQPTFSSEEKAYIRFRISEVFPKTDCIRGLSYSEQKVVKTLLESQNLE